MHYIALVFFFPTVVLLLCYICCEYIKNMPLSSWENWVHPPGGRLGRAVFAPRDQGHRQWPQVWQPHPIVIKKLQLIAINCKKQCCKDVTNMHTSFGKKLGAPPGGRLRRAVCGPHHRGHHQRPQVWPSIGIQTRNNKQYINFRLQVIGCSTNTIVIFGIYIEAKYHTKYLLSFK